MGAGRIEARGGNDIIKGLGGDDTLLGGPGGDIMQGGGDLGEDLMFGGFGRDYMTTLHDDGVSAFIDCGPGRDLITYLGSRDTTDRLVHCEVVRVETPGD